MRERKGSRQHIQDLPWTSRAPRYRRRGSSQARAARRRLRAPAWPAHQVHLELQKLFWSRTAAEAEAEADRRSRSRKGEYSCLKFLLWMMMRIFGCPSPAPFRKTTISSTRPKTAKKPSTASARATTSLVLLDVNMPHMIGPRSAEGNQGARPVDHRDHAHRVLERPRRRRSDERRRLQLSRKADQGRKPRLPGRQGAQGAAHGART